MNGRLSDVLCSCLCCLGSLAAAELLTPAVLPIANSQAYVFTAALSNGAPLTLMVLDGDQLRVYSLPDTAASATIRLPQDTSAVDLFDIDADGESELLVVSGPRVMAGSIIRNHQDSAWKTLVERESLLSHSSGAPYPRVLASSLEDAVVIALPQSTGFEYWQLDGQLHSSTPYDQSGSPNGIAVTSVGPESLNAASAGAEATMVHRIRRMSEEGRPEERSDPRGTLNSPADPADLDVSELPSEHWPSFPLELKPNSSANVLHAPIPPGFEDSYIRFQPTSSGGAPVDDAGPRRRYPGRVVTGGDRLPDFNGDGYVDLVCWKSAQIGASINTLFAALRDGTWPIQLSVHLYDSKRKLYSAAPIGSIEVSLPSEWHEADPIRNLQFRDFDDDGLLDVGFSTHANRYQIWTYEIGFSNVPQYEIETPGPIESILPEFEQGSGSENITLLRGAQALYVVHFPPR